MTDIVEWLRREAQLEAAAEIERLRADVTQMRKVQGGIEELHCEIERLRTGRMMSLEELKAWREDDQEDAIALHRNCIIKILDEIERLRAKVV